MIWLDEYDMDYDELQLGNVVSFDLYENYTFELDGENVVEVYDAWYAGNDDGEITVSTPDDKHVFEIDLEEYYFLGDSEGEETEDLVNESLTGYFSGELEVLSMNETPAKIASKLRGSAKRIVRLK